MELNLNWQRYLFDLNGYLVISNALDQGEINELDTLIDVQSLPQPREKIRFGQAAGGSPSCPGFLDWGKPFCNLLDHKKILPLLRVALGDWIRLDRLYGINMEKDMAGYELHGGNSPHSPGESYYVHDGKIHNTFLVAAWNLTEGGPRHGGFCCVPGSHKSNFQRPATIPTENQGRWKLVDDGKLMPGVVVPEAPKGSVILFSEALTHGTAPWTGNHQRRTLLYKYCQSHIAWSALRVQPPANISLSPRQELLFREPANGGTFFPSLFRDSKT